MEFIMQIKQTDLWPTRIWEIEDIFDEQFNQNLLEELLQWREEFGSWTGVNPNHFNSDKPLINIARNKFMEIIEECVSPLFGEEWPEIERKFQKGWLHVCPPGTYTNVHPHDGATMAMVYYLQADKNSGDLVLIDPRRGSDITDVKTRCSKCINYTPKVGKMIIIPGYLFHEVLQNNSNRNR